MPPLRPGIGKQQEDPVEAAIRQGVEEQPRVLRPEPDIADAVARGARQEGRHAVDEDLRADDADLGMAQRLGREMLATAEADLEPERGGRLAEQRGRVEEYAKEFNQSYEAGKRPRHVPEDVALPCATQNELEIDDARALIANGVRCVAEGANMPTTMEAAQAFIEANVLYAPGKASNAGGVAVSGLEMSQNALRLSWPREEVDSKLHAIMRDIHENCVAHGGEGKTVNYLNGANIAGFVKVAAAMLAQGVY